tara:strand:+ start:1842 stop:2585 length:744 start_codon:yes stop_codon:yes gene_type:complete
MDKKYIFLHVPKVAGTTVINLLPGADPNGCVCPARKPRSHNINEICSLEYITPEICSRIIEQQYTAKIHHYTIEQYIKSGILTKDDFKNNFSFTFVRNPFDRMVSEYLYRLKILEPASEDPPWPHHPDGTPHAFPTFNQFVAVVAGLFQEASAKEGGLPLHSHMGNHLLGQHEYVQYSDITIKNIFRYENFQEDIKKVMDILNLKSEVGHFKKSNRNKDYRVYYSPASRNLMEFMYAEDLKLFGYKF